MPLCKRGIRLFLHLIDKSDSPNRSAGTHQEPLYDAPNDHTVILHVGKGTQTLKWLALAAQGRLKMLRRRTDACALAKFVAGTPTSCPKKSRLRNVEGHGSVRPHCDVFKNEGHVWIEFDESGGNVTHWKGTHSRHTSLGRVKGIPLEAPMTTTRLHLQD